MSYQRLTPDQILSIMGYAQATNVAVVVDADDPPVVLQTITPVFLGGLSHGYLTLVSGVGDTPSGTIRILNDGAPVRSFAFALAADSALDVQLDSFSLNTGDPTEFTMDIACTGDPVTVFRSSFSVRPLNPPMPP